MPMALAKMVENEMGEVGKGHNTQLYAHAVGCAISSAFSGKHHRVCKRRITWLDSCFTIAVLGFLC